MQSQRSINVALKFNVAAVALTLVLGGADTFKERGQDNALVARSQHRPSLTGRALLPKPTIGPPQFEQTCTGVMARAPLKEAGREARPELACPTETSRRRRHMRRPGAKPR